MASKKLSKLVEDVIQTIKDKIAYDLDKLDHEERIQLMSSIMKDHTSLYCILDKIVYHKID